jgi:CRISPR/Cas system-associated exonuclease Cas4 (RecB family)
MKKKKKKKRNKVAVNINVRGWTWGEYRVKHPIFFSVQDKIEKK